MKVVVKTLTFSTREKFELVNITDEVEKAVSESGIINGICLIFAPHATGAIVANENEKGLIRDILDHISQLFPPGKNWLHNRIDDNAHAHVASSIIGASLTLPVINGKVIRGTWQDVFFVEMDGPRTNRRVIIEVLGE
ncbi:secondary thiamine-phosphate synthase enzyme YjbQ [Infirmifilum sp. NZ]|uniref:secondary thiamine-phosphate synthase enzyme YjbQ n=1 Tax=Infirmifilum sp. NZ TaxID=2926850 RepID=UPI0027A2AD65|nr:secondary thiamine-phosphate synthase enzyme YjbQ [Infirmifilum sp. NZ]UNQ72659.1 secondary thiamine-phosphate synthase enzyme YjbQ [Infirmifilum sp. NZ]